MCTYFGIFGHFFQKLGKILFNFLATLFVENEMQKFNELFICGKVV
jgi:hypothetical protein